MGKAKDLLDDGIAWTDNIARLMMPILLERAQSAKTISYGEMRHELLTRHGEHEVHAAQYGYPAGKIGDVIIALSEEWGESVPPLNALLVNAKTKLPGKGVDYYLRHFVGNRRPGRLSTRERQAIAEQTIEAVFDYPKLSKVAQYFGFKANGTKPKPGSAPIKRPKARIRGDGGESQAHKQLKAWVAAHPQAFRKHGKWQNAQCEFYLESGDEIDVLFENDQGWLGVEVKAANASESELCRGVFQCVKYRATMRAMRKADAKIPNARVVLVIESNPSKVVQDLAKRLDVTWLNVGPLRD